MPTFRRRGAFALATLCLCNAAGAAGVPLQAAPGPWPALTGLAAQANTARTAFFNPAGLGRLDESESVVQLAYLLSESESTDAITGLELSRGTKDSDDLIIPAYFYSRPLTEKWDFGFSLVAPAGFGDDYDESSVQRYFATEWSLIYVSANPSLSYQLNDRWSLGATASINYVNYRVEAKVLNLDTPGSNDGDVELTADDVSLAFNAGVLYQPSGQTRFGLVYRQGADAKLKDDLKFSNLSPGGTTERLIRDSGLGEADIEVSSQLPDIVDVGVFHEFDSGLAVAADLLWFGFSDFVLTEFAILEGTALANEPEYDDVFAASAGISYPWNSRLTLGASVGMIDNPVDDDERSLLFRIDEAYIVGLGAEYRLSDSSLLTVNLNFGEVGDGRVETPELPLLGQITSEYDERRFLVFDVQYRWR